MATTVAEGAADAALARGRHGALAWGPEAADLRLAAAAAPGLAALVLAAVGPAAPCGRREGRGESETQMDLNTK